MEAINWQSFFFLFFAAIACAFAVAVVMTGNIVRMAAYLVVSLGAVAGLFFLAGADFLGAVQLMVYVGGTMVLLGLWRDAHRARAVRVHENRRRPVDFGHHPGHRFVGHTFANGIKRGRLVRGQNVSANTCTPMFRPHRPGWAWVFWACVPINPKISTRSPGRECRDTCWCLKLFRSIYWSCS